MEERTRGEERSGAERGEIGSLGEDEGKERVTKNNSVLHQRRAWCHIAAHNYTFTYTHTSVKCICTCTHAFPYRTVL